MVKFVYLPFVPVKGADVETVINRLQVWYQSRGPVWTADRAKLARLALTRYLAGTPLPVPAGLSLTADGLPRVLPHGIRQLIRDGNPRVISLALTLLSVTRSILGGKPVDYSPITSVSSFQGSRELEAFIPIFIAENKIKEFKFGSGKFHWSTKSGPNGPALQTALVDILYLPDSLKESIITLAPHLKISFDILDRWKEGILIDVLNRVSKVKTPYRGLIRRLSIKPDREAKSRVFAILDYWSQNAMKELHDQLFQVLKLFPSDCTFTQGHGLTLRAEPGQSYHSLDLTSATDRFPVSLQVTLLKHLIGEDKAAAWKDIMIGYEYVTPEGNSVAYAAGQPMGAHSSWPLFTLSHHLVVQYCASLVGYTNFTQYRLLGDDIVIANDAVAAEYKKFMTDILGVAISPTKSHVSEDTFEIAKRWLFRGVEVTPFPVVGFSEFKGKFHLIGELWKTTLGRGFEYLGKVGNARSLVPLLEALGYSGRLLARELKFIRAFLILESFTTLERDVNRISEVKTFLSLFNLSWNCTWRDATIVERFDDIASSEFFSRQGAMADLAGQKVRHWRFALATELEDQADLGPDDQSELSDHWAEAIPGVAVLSAKAGESFDTVMESAQASQLPSDLVWKKLPYAKVMAIPSESGIIPTRAAHLRTGAAAVLIKDIVKKYYSLQNDRIKELRT